MSVEELNEIKEKFDGEWKVDRSECFEDFLREVGHTLFFTCTAMFTQRGVVFYSERMASMAKPISTIKVDLDEMRITVAMNAGFMVKADTFKLGEEFDTDHQGKKSRAVVKYEDGKLVQSNTPEDENIKPTKATRERVGDEMLLTMYIGDVVCKRYFKRVVK